MIENEIRSIQEEIIRLEDRYYSTLDEDKRRRIKERIRELTEELHRLSVEWSMSWRYRVNKRLHSGKR